jgi:hypothetical protein
MFGSRDRSLFLCSSRCKDVNQKHRRVAAMLLRLIDCVRLAAIVRRRAILRRCIEPPFNGSAVAW